MKRKQSGFGGVATSTIQMPDCQIYFQNCFDPVFTKNKGNETF